MTAALFAALLVTFPAENQKLPATARTYVIGAAETNRRERLYLNDVEIDVYRTGAFLTMVKVSPGVHIDGAAALLDAMTVRQKHYADIGEQLKN